MGDAEIIPIGTGGRPGRGTGKRSPSSSSRSLAGKPAKSATKSASPSAREPEPEAEPTPARKAPPPRKPRAAAPGPAHEPARTQERSLLGGIAPQEWLGALQDAARELFGEEWELRLAQFLAFLRRRLTGEYEVDEFGFDAELTRTVLLTALRPIAQRWFRVEVHGAENIPATGGALVVSNHSGTVPVDGLMTMSMIHETTGRHLRPLGADLVFALPVVSKVARTSGATLACNADAERMLGAGELVGVWPRTSRRFC